MIISDLNYLENTSEEVLGGFGSIKFIKINITETVKINKNVNSNVKITGNLSTGEVQATAFGKNTLTEAFVTTFTAPNSSSASAFGVSATKD